MSAPDPSGAARRAQEDLEQGAALAVTGFLAVSGLLAWIVWSMPL